MAGSRNDLWQQLGISSTTDESAIRRAYAKRLREVRPDEDAEGFQRLVEARDRALWLARHAVEAARWELSADDEEPDAGPPHAAQIEDVRERPAALTIEQPEPVIRPSEAADRGRDHDHAARAAVLGLLDTVLRRSSDAGVPPNGKTHRAPSPDAAMPHEPADSDWRQIAERVAGLSMTDRTAIQPDLIRRLSAYVTAQDSAFGDWHALNGHRIGMRREFAEWLPAAWPFFDLVAQFAAEFGWREQDRIIHLYLPHSEADRFMDLLAWTHHVADAGPRSPTAETADGLPRIPAVDLYAFYDGGRDLVGLRAWRTIRDNARLWQASDPVTDLFFPFRALREGRHLKGMLGLLGWTGLIAAYAPWRFASVAQALPWIVPQPESVLDVLFDLWPWGPGIWILYRSEDWTFRKRYSFVGAPTSKVAEIPFDMEAFVFFPIWAFGRRFYFRGVVSLMAWGAVLQQIITMGADYLVDFRSHAGPFFLAAALHAAAGFHGQRWVVEKLLRTFDAVNRAGLGDPAERWLYIRQRRTTNGYLVWIAAIMLLFLTWRGR